MRKSILIILVLLSVSGAINAQERVQKILEDLLETYGSEPEENVDFQEVIDNLTYFSQHPIAINEATKDNLLQLYFLSDMQIEDLLAFRKRTGQIYSIYEMATIEGFTMELLQKLEPFISFQILENGTNYKRSDNDIILRSTRSFSSSEDKSKISAYEGSMERYYLRFKHRSNDFEYGMVGEKDPGEAFLRGSNNYGFDYMGAYANFKIGKSGQKVFLGDYNIRFGQGLVASQGFSMGKSSEPTQVFRFGQGVRSSSSTDENQFFRGIASQLKIGRFTLMPFVSFRQLDAHIDTMAGKSTFSAFQTSGYHRTPSEIAGKNALQQLVVGSNAGYSYKRWSFGFTAVLTQFNAELDRSDDLSNQYLWEGKQHVAAGMDWKGSIRNVFFFGEIAASPTKGKALLSGILLKPAANAELTAVYRTINKTYFSFFSNAFTESSRVNDEKAMYLGFKYLPASSWTLRGYADFFKYKWIKYTTAAPSSGIELSAQLTYSPSKRTELYLRFFEEEKAVKVTSRNYKYNEVQKIDRYRINFIQQVNRNFSLKSRIELSLYSKIENEKGWLVYQDIIYKPVARSFSMNGRLAYYETEGYNSRLYAFENDLLYSFSIPALYGKGLRTYLNIKQSFSRELTLWLKVAAEQALYQPETESIDEQKTKYELKVQLRYQF